MQVMKVQKVARPRALRHSELGKTAKVKGWLALFLVTFLILQPALAQQPAPHSPTAPPGVAIGDHARQGPPASNTNATRDAAAAQAPASAAPAAPAAPGAPVSLTSDSLLGKILVGLSAWSASLSGQLATVGQAVSRLPLIWQWMARLASDPFEKSNLFDVAWRLVTVLVIAGGARWLAFSLLQRPMRAVERRAKLNHEQRQAARAARAAAPVAASGEGTIASKAELRFLRRVPLALARLFLELAPILAFALVGNSLLATPLNRGGALPLVILAAVNAYVVQHVVMALGRTLASTNSRDLRLFPLSDETAAYTEVWLGRITGIAIYGIAVLEIARILGLYPAAYLAGAKLIILINHLLLSVVVLQCRRGVAATIAAPPGSQSPFALARNRLAQVWHIIAIFMLMALWFVWAAEIRNGYSLLLRYSGATIVVLIVGRRATVAVLSILDRVFRIDPETTQKLPFLEVRANRYYPLLRRVVSRVLGIVTALAVLQIWGVDAVGWFGDGRLGERIAASAIIIFIAVTVSVLIWEGANASMERRITALSARGDYGGSARLRTLLPLIRSALLVCIAVVVGFTALSQLGVNIAPLLAGAGIIGVALGFGSQKLVQDVITGVFLLLENAMQVGDWVTVSGLSGTVENLSIRTIRLRAGDGSVHIIPFSSVTTVTNTNRGIGNAAVSVTVAGGEDTDRVGEVLKEIGAEIRADPAFRDQVLDDFALWGVDKVDGATATVLGQMRCKDTGRWGVQREFNRRIKRRFQDAGIQIAVPTQTIMLARAPGHKAGTQDSYHQAAAGDSTGAEKQSPPPAALGNTQ
jgi:small-conductance mechanosensitive channel